MRIIEIKQDMGEYDFFIKWRMTWQCNLMCPYCVRGKGTKEVNQDRLQFEFEKLKKTAITLSQKIDEITFDNIKIELIGGEVTIFDLVEILKGFTTKKNITFHLTSNMSKDAEYYKELATFIKSKGYNLSITCSYHYLSQSLDSFIFKCNAIKNDVLHLMTEMPSLEENQKEVQDFYERVQKENLEYAIEGDFRVDGTLKDLFIASSRKENPRVTVTYDDGTIKKYKTRNAMWRDQKDVENVDHCRWIKNDKYCDACYKTMYIDWRGDRIIAVQRSENHPYGDMCRPEVSIEDWSQLPEPIKCHNVCDLCGLMSVSEKKENLL